MATIPTKNNRPINITGTVTERLLKITDVISQLWDKTLGAVRDVDVINEYLRLVKKSLHRLDETKLENPVDYIDFNTSWDGEHQEGRLHWNPDEGCVEIGMPGGNVNVQLGLEMLMPRRMRNDTGIDIKNGDVVYTISGSGKIGLAKADSFLTSRVTGIATEDIDDGSSGWVCTYGIIRGDDAQPLDTSSYSVGASLFLSATTAGAFTGTVPSAPNYKVFVGRVVRSHAVQGEIYVRSISTPTLSGLSDVTETSAADGAILKWNNTEGYYEHSNNEPAYEDLNFAVVRSGGPVATRPNDVTINNVYHKEFTSLNNQSCGDTAELYHASLLGQTLYPHYHGFLKSGESAGTTGATFRIYWELRQLSGTTTGYVDLTVTSAQLTANAHKVDIYDLTGFTGPTELGAQLALSLHRTAGDAGDVIIETYGCHVALDGIGSRTPTVK